MRDGIFENSCNGFSSLEKKLIVFQFAIRQIHASLNIKDLHPFDLLMNAEQLNIDMEWLSYMVNQSIKIAKQIQKIQKEGNEND